MNQEENKSIEQENLKAFEEGMNAFKALPRKDKITLLKAAIKSTQVTIEASTDKTERLRLYKELGQLIMNLDSVRMNKHNSSFFEFIPFNGYNRRARKQMGLR